MLKEKQLNNDLTSYKSSLNLSADGAIEMMKKVAAQNEIPINVEVDRIKIGGFFNSKEYDCLVVSHPEHQRDYYKIVIMAGYGEMMLATTGVSKQMKKFAIAETAKNKRKGKNMSYKIGNVIGSSLWLLGKSKNKLEAEQAYYDAVIQIAAITFEFE